MMRTEMAFETLVYLPYSRLILLLAWESFITFML